MDKIHFNSELQHLVSENLRRFDHVENNMNGFQGAAVAITIVEYQDKACLPGIVSDPSNDCAAIILTRRSRQLKNHSGQWALPGGKIDEGESAEEAALRELDEEVGLKVVPLNILGTLDVFFTRSGFAIVPVVIWGGMVEKLYPNPGEVDSIHRIPLSEFFRNDSPLLVDEQQSRNPILYMPVGNTAIATPTAALLYQFKEVALEGKSTRVAHYEEPRFAWK